MIKKLSFAIFLFALVAATILIFAACGKETMDPVEVSESESVTEETSGEETEPEEEKTDIPTDRYDAATTPRTGKNATDSLVLSTGVLDGKFSPFFNTSESDRNAVALTQLYLLDTDSDGIPVAGIDKASYAYSFTQKVKTDDAGDVTSEYNFILKNGLTFSDGEPITAKNILFAIYVYCDPLYDGASTFHTMNIKGMNDYRSQTTPEISRKYSELGKKIFSAGINEDGTYPEIDGVTAEEQQIFWSYLDVSGEKFAKEIVDSVYEQYSTYVESFFAPYTLEDISSSNSLKTAYGMVMWGFAELNPDTKIMTLLNGDRYDLDKDTITTALYWNSIKLKYGNNFSTADGIDSETAGSLIEDIMYSSYILNEGSKEVGGSVESISGITYGTSVCDDGVEREYIKVIIDGVDPMAIFRFIIEAAPIHYYTEGYTGELNEFGVAPNTSEFIAHLKTKNNAPFGAGPYVFKEYTDNVVTYTANALYLLGSPKIANLRYQEISPGSELDALKTGIVHYAAPSATKDIINSITQGEGDFQKLAYTLVDNDGYGFIGIQGQYFSDFRVRKAIAHALDVDLVVSDYYGELASANYRTMTKVQWAYPENTEKLYAYDGTGETSKELLIEAGYIYDEEANIMYYPAEDERAGQQFSIKFTFPSALENHPSGCIALDFQRVFANIGINVYIETDSELSDKLSTAYESGIQMWVDARSSGGVDPDMFRIWYSDPAVNQSEFPAQSGAYYLFENGSGDQKKILKELNALIITGKNTIDTEECKEIYKKALELSTSLAVEVPTYQQKNMFVFNKEVIKADTLLYGANVTPFCSPVKYLHLVELN